MSPAVKIPFETVDANNCGYTETFERILGFQFSEILSDTDSGHEIALFRSNQDMTGLNTLRVRV